jgi:hypothetical protein
MKSSEGQLQQMFVQATDEVIPPAPWLEAQVVDALQRSKRPRRRRLGLSTFGGFGSGIRLAAGLVALAIAVGTVAALLMSSQLLHNPPMPGGRSTPLPVLIVPFTPSPAVRASNWPIGGPVPAQLDGSWQPPSTSPLCKAAFWSGCTLHLGGNTFQVGEETPTAPPPTGTIGPPLFGNVVVNGSEIDFLSDICLADGSFGFERFTYTLTGNNLVITKASAPGQSNCSWQLGPSLWPLIAGTYTRVSAPLLPPIQ